MKGKNMQEGGIFLGSFPTESSAAKAHDVAALCLQPDDAAAHQVPNRCALQCAPCCDTLMRSSLVPCPAALALPHKIIVTALYVAGKDYILGHTSCWWMPIPISGQTIQHTAHDLLPLYAHSLL